VEGQLLCPAEKWVKFLILQEGTWKLLLQIMEEQNLDLGKNMNNKKIIKVMPCHLYSM